MWVLGGGDPGPAEFIRGERGRVSMFAAFSVTGRCLIDAFVWSKVNKTVSSVVERERERVCVCVCVCVSV